ncbi:MAG: threo-3-hydroxy-L-aspartate ammonia-lyase [Burkholderiales bacterium]|nr:threo-3-hydroxy-L-aspartate ammonia-lyase [Burkholderiales bacterium]
MSDLAITFQDIQAAHARIGAVAHETPVMTSTTADQMTGAQLFFKCENLQRSGAFKIRGAYNAIAQFTAAQRAAGVMTFSSGNHGQAIALAARMQGVPAVVYMPQDAPEMKIAATRGYGAEIRLYDRYQTDPNALVQPAADASGMTFIPPFDHPHVMAGQGTVAKELIETVGALDILVAPTGGGGLLSGTAIATAALRPDCEVYGVEPDSANDAQQSLRSGHIVRSPVMSTSIADAARTPSLGQYTFPVIHRHVRDIVTVSDAELVATMAFFASRMKLIVEPTGCLAAAAVLHNKLDVRGVRVGIIVSGGNVDLSQFAKLTASA